MLCCCCFCCSCCCDCCCCCCCLCLLFVRFRFAWLLCFLGFNLTTLLLAFASCVALLFVIHFCCVCSLLTGLGPLLAALGPLWVALRPLLGALGLLLGRPGAPLGPVLGALGGSWGALGELLAALGTILERSTKIIQKWMPKMTDLGSQKGAQREPKSNPKLTKIDDKNRCEKNTSSRSSWSRLGAILGDLGSHLGTKNRLKPFVLNGFVNIRVFQKMACPEPS